jgi:hypothetical protein
VARLSAVLALLAFVSLSETTKSIAFPERPCFADLDKGRSQHFSGVVV